MGDAGDALKQSDLNEAGDQEGRAVENLRQGARSMAEQMMRSGGRRGGSQANRDPLGRKQGDRLDDGDSVKVPNEITVQRARAILEELRTNSASPHGRPSSSITSNVSSSRIRAYPPLMGSQAASQFCFVVRLIGKPYRTFRTHSGRAALCYPPAGSIFAVNQGTKSGKV